jgi:iron complex outermembrane receptor protein
MRMQPDASKEMESPQHQFQLRSYLDITHNVRLTAAAYHVGRISPSLDNDRVSLPAYLRFDLGVSWQPTKSLELGVWGQNLLDPRHSEFGSFKTKTLTEIPRSIVGRITWSF